MKSQTYPQVSFSTLKSYPDLTPILSSLLVLYEYTNKERDIVKSAFRPANYHSIRDLPNDLAPFSVG